MIAPMVNPYEPSMTKEERRRTWAKWTAKKKLMYSLAKKFPRLLPSFYRRTFLSGKHGLIDKWLSLSLGNRVSNLDDQVFDQLRLWTICIDISVFARIL